MTKHRVREYTSILMVLPILESGSMTSNTVMGMKNGLMEQSIRAAMLMVLSKGMDCSPGLMGTNIKESSGTTILKGMESIYGWMDESTKDFGKVIKCMAGALSFGLTVANMLGTTLIKKRMERENFSGLMVGLTRGSGRTANRTGRECTVTRKVSKGRGSGQMGKR
jgi:hypothetical protein